MRGLGIRLGFIAVIVVIGLIIRPFVSGGAGDLKVGDCFDPPTNTGTVKDVQHHPCTDAHGGEVILVEKHPDASSYPSDDAFQQFINDQCLPAYTSYTGKDLAS